MDWRLERAQGKETAPSFQPRPNDSRDSLLGCQISAEQLSDFVYTPGRTTILFNKENQIHIQVTQTDGVQLINEKKEIQLIDASESVRPDSEAVGNIRYWYKNALYLYGYQTIKNQEKGNRDVFFINKLKID